MTTPSPDVSGDIDTCTCPHRADGFSKDAETGRWVHAKCNRPTRAWLEAARAAIARGEPVR